MKARQVGRVSLLAAFFAIVGLFVQAPVYGVTPSDGGTFYLPQNIPVYTGPYGATPGEWDVDATLSSGSVKNGGGLVGFQYRINAGDTSFLWNGNQLSQDISSLVSGSWLAEGEFLGGGTITVDGVIRAPNNIPLFTGELLIASVEEFRLRETDPNSNIINSVVGTIRIDVTGGWLYTNATYPVQGLYDLALISAMTGPMVGGPLDDFQQDLVSRQAFSMQYNRVVPEPAAWLLMLSAAGLILNYRRACRA